MQFGIERFARRNGAAISGVLVVDLPAEAKRRYRGQLRRRKIDLIFLVDADHNSDSRLKLIARLASGFIYAVARTGVTGTARELADESAKASSGEFEP